MDFRSDVLLQDDGQGAYIKEWNLDIAQPTDEQLASHEAQANTAESNAQVDATIKAAYGDIGEQLDEITMTWMLGKQEYNKLKRITQRVNKWQ